MKEKTNIKSEEVKHTVTIQVPRKTWELLEWICNFDIRREPRRQISYFLTILSGETIPTDTLTLELYRPLYGLLKRFKESDHREAEMELNAIIQQVAFRNHGVILQGPWSNPGAI